MKLTIFLLLRARPEWLALERSHRSRIGEEALSKAFLSDALTFRFFDAEAFSAHASDVVIIETDQIEDYYFAIERLRDSPLFTAPYFDLVEIIPAIENGFRIFEEQEQSDAA